VELKFLNIKLDSYDPSMILATSGVQGVIIWQFLFYCDMRSGDGRLQKSPDFSPEKKKKKLNRHLAKKIRQEKKRADSHSIVLETTNQPCPQRLQVCS
jgi:hypothetical protein